MTKKAKRLLIVLVSVLISAHIFALPMSEAAATAAQPPKILLKQVIYYVFEDSKNLLQIGIMGENGENKKVLTKEGNNWCPTVSPDGERVAFFSDRSGFINIFVMYVDGTQQKQLSYDEVENEKIDLYNRGQLSWTGDSLRLLFLKRGNILQIDLNGENQTSFTDSNDVTTFKMSPDNSRIIYTREKTRQHNGLWLYLYEGAGINDVKEKQITPSSIINASFDWGSDNTSLAYFNNRGIFTISCFGLSNKLIKTTYYINNDVVWSQTQKDPNENNIAFISDENNGPNIWITKPDGTNLTQITKNGGASPCWFPDGKNLLYIEENDIFKYDVSAKEMKKLTYYFNSYYPVVANIKMVITKEHKPSEISPLKLATPGTDGKSVPTSLPEKSTGVANEK
ncbi:MAG: hypothetical protein WCJ46_03310 [bacterium]